MKPIEVQVLATSMAEHAAREAITDFVNDADAHPGRHADHAVFGRLHEAWVATRDAQRLAQANYAKVITPDPFSRGMAGGDAA